ncbi:tRNA preQ [Sesbania bispinosa]|nr:tRNA preQ [Sesbania bispinosa]
MGAAEATPLHCFSVGQPTPASLVCKQRCRRWSFLLWALSSSPLPPHAPSSLDEHPSSLSLLLDASAVAFAAMSPSSLVEHLLEQLVVAVTSVVTLPFVVGVTFVATLSPSLVEKLHSHHPFLLRSEQNHLSLNLEVFRDHAKINRGADMIRMISEMGGMICRDVDMINRDADMIYRDAEMIN